MPEINTMEAYSIEELNAVREISNAQGCKNRSCGTCVFNNGGCTFSLTDFTKEVIENEILKRVAAKEKEKEVYIKNQKNRYGTIWEGLQWEEFETGGEPIIKPCSPPVSDQVFLLKVNSSTFNKKPTLEESEELPCEKEKESGPVFNDCTFTVNGLDSSFLDNIIEELTKRNGI